MGTNSRDPDRQEAVRWVTERIEQEAAAIRGEIADEERSAQLVDARAVPVIVIGIVLTSIPDVIAQSAVASGLDSRRADLVAGGVDALLGLSRAILTR